MWVDVPLAEHLSSSLFRGGSLLELGAGLGMLAHDILQHARAESPQFYAALQYVIGERSAALRVKQEETNAFTQIKPPAPSMTMQQA